MSPTEQQIKAWHELFLTAAELTKDAKNILEVAQRFIDKGMVITSEPSESAWLFEEQAGEFSSALGEALWDPDKSQDFKNESDTAKGKH